LCLQTKGGAREQYAPVAYPNLAKDVAKFFVMTLGPEVETEVETIYRSKLHSSTKQKLPFQPQRQTPRFLRIIVAADDDDGKQRHRLTVETGDVVMLKWDVVKQYAGSAADTLKTTPGSVLN
jgi:hypothetical protein